MCIYRKCTYLAACVHVALVYQQHRVASHMQQGVAGWQRILREATRAQHTAHSLLWCGARILAAASTHLFQVACASSACLCQRLVIRVQLAGLTPTLARSRIQRLAQVRQATCGAAEAACKRTCMSET